MTGPFPRSAQTLFEILEGAAFPIFTISPMLPQSRTFWVVCLLLSISVGAGTIFAPQRRVTRVPADTDWTNALQPAYVGNATCAGCHADQFAAWETSGHSETFHDRQLCERYPDLVAHEATDPERGGVFRWTCEGGGLLESYTKDDQTIHLPIQFALGSGRHATTFLTLLPSDDNEPTALEHRLTLYASTGELGLTPSHTGEPVERPEEQLGRLRRGHVRACIGCHTTTAVVRGTQLGDLRPNVGCESCHGPGRQHVAGAHQGASSLALDFGPLNASAGDEVALCGRCHRSPENLTISPDPDDPKLARFQPVGLKQSACYRKSSGALRCSTCHDPHQTVDHNLDRYTARCRACHSQPETQAICPKAPDGNCIECHMPKVEVHPGIVFRDHWIRPRDPADP